MKAEKRILVDEATGDTEKLQIDQIRLQRLKQEYNRFSKVTGLRTQPERAQVAGFGVKQAGAAKAAANQYYKHWSKSVGVNESAKTLANYCEMRYNRPDEYALLKQYVKGVNSGWISPLSGFENYKALHQRITSEIVGKTAADGTVIAGQVPHFLQRVIGTMVDPEKLKRDLRIIRRSGVEFEDIVQTIFFPQETRPIKTDRNGKRSRKFLGAKCAVTINPDTGMLIQTNPLGGDKNV